jgi:hypothetical protein
MDSNTIWSYGHIRKSPHANKLLKLTSFRDQPRAVSEMTLLTQNRGHDNVLLGKDYRTPYWAVTDEFGVMVGWWLAG